MTAMRATYQGSKIGAKRQCAPREPGDLPGDEPLLRISMPGTRAPAYWVLGAWWASPVLPPWEHLSR
jgi:hypothetical protein